MIIENIISSRGEDFSWVSTTPSCYDYDDEDFIEDEPVEELPSSPTLATLMNIRNLCDTIQNNIVNSDTEYAGRLVSDKDNLGLGIALLQNNSILSVCALLKEILGILSGSHSGDCAKLSYKVVYILISA